MVSEPPVEQLVAIACRIRRRAIELLDRAVLDGDEQAIAALAALAQIDEA